MPSGLLIAVVVTLAAPPDADPVVARVNARLVRRSVLDAEVGRSGDPSVRSALRRLLGRELLLQEAELSGLGKGLPTTPPQARAQAFLERVIPRRTVCASFSETEVAEMYAAMKPRFVRGDLYDVAELRVACPTGGAPEDAACLDRAETWAREHWGPLEGEVRDSAEVRWLSLLATVSTEYREVTIHVDPSGRASAPKDVADAVVRLGPGGAALVDGRIEVLLDHRPPIARRLDDPGVRDEVAAELCPRQLAAHRERYLSDLLGSADVEIVRAALPPGADVKDGQRP